MATFLQVRAKFLHIRANYR